MLPNSLIIRAYCFRGARLWLTLRALLSALFVVAGGEPFDVPVAVAVAIIALSVFLSFLDTYRYRERVMLGNLGVRPSVLAGLFFIPAIIGEATLFLGSSAL